MSEHRQAYVKEHHKELEKELDEMRARKTKNSKSRILKKERDYVFRRLSWVGTIFSVLLLDQLSKWYVTEHLIRPSLSGQTGYDFLNWYIHTPGRLPFAGMPITSYFNIVMAWNTGVSFSMFSGMGGVGTYILIAISLVITILFSIWLWRAENNLHGFCYAFVIGGALGNVIDRARFGAVIDFLDFHAYEQHWPAFNVADMAIVIGIFLLVVVSLFFDIKRKRRYRKTAKKNRAFRKYILKTFGR